MRDGSKIFLLEDDATLHETIRDFLEQKGYTVESAYDGIEAQDMLYEKKYDLLLLDVNTPLMNGYELLQSIRTRGVGTPAIFVTARSSMEDLEDGFESGCDDYIRKPFELKELAIRIKILIRRRFFHESRDHIEIGKDIKYDVANSQLIVSGKNIHLGTKESKLLKLFLQSRDEVITHERIYDVLWGYEETPSDTSLRTYIKNLRKIIGKDKIASIKKQGYRFTSQG